MKTVELWILRTPLLALLLLGLAMVLPVSITRAQDPAPPDRDGRVTTDCSACQPLVDRMNGNLEETDLTQHQIANRRRHIFALGQERRPLEQQVSEIEQQIQTIDARIPEVERELDRWARSDSIADAFSTKTAALQGELTGLYRLKSQLQERLRDRTVRIQQLEADRLSTAKEVVALREKEARLEVEFIGLERALSECEQTCTVQPASGGAGAGDPGGRGRDPDAS